jgi:hypothetical protein
MVWKWTSFSTYSASSAYEALFRGQTVMLGAKEVWRMKAPREHKFFLSLVIQDTCWTSERRRWHDLTTSAGCALCSQADASIDHLLVGCIFSREVWWFQWRRRINRPRCRAFDSVVTMITKLLWLQRNEVVFHGSSPMIPNSVLQLVLRTCEQWCAARLVMRLELYVT